MKWILKLLSALARPLGISSPEDLRKRPASQKVTETSLRATSTPEPKAKDRNTPPPAR
jgi:hypothetical protein